VFVVYLRAEARWMTQASHRWVWSLSCVELIGSICSYAAQRG